MVNNDKNSNQFKKWESFDLSSENRLQILVPPKFGNGHVVLSEKAIFHYKQNTQYDRKSQFTIKWNDPEFSFKWKIDSPILSDRDKVNMQNILVTGGSGFIGTNYLKSIIGKFKVVRSNYFHNDNFLKIKGVDYKKLIWRISQNAKNYVEKLM